MEPQLENWNIEMNPPDEQDVVENERYRDVIRATHDTGRVFIRVVRDTYRGVNDYIIDVYEYKDLFYVPREDTSNWDNSIISKEVHPDENNVKHAQTLGEAVELVMGTIMTLEEDDSYLLHPLDTPVHAFYRFDLEQAMGQFMELEDTTNLITIDDGQTPPSKDSETNELVVQAALENGYDEVAAILKRGRENEREALYRGPVKDERDVEAAV